MKTEPPLRDAVARLRLQFRVLFRIWEHGTRDTNVNGIEGD
jgi:hypothetical protein